jgi:SAM-dependent methyltransferase
MKAIDSLIPPAELMFVGSSLDSFSTVGKETVRQLIELGGLLPGHRVLDVGCGVGRMALPLTGYLQPPGSYEGFDVVAPGIDWCRSNITPHFPHFRFQTANLFNSEYTPRTGSDSSEYAFPYPRASFDFVFLTSVFTHMLPSAVENYLFEVARVLKPGGRCFATFFLWNQETAALVRAARSLYSFPYDEGIYRVHDNRRPEHAVAYDEAYVLSLLNKYGFELHGPVHYGGWSGRQPSYTGQDIILAVRTPSHAARKPRQSACVRLAMKISRLRRRLAAGMREVLHLVSLGRWQKDWQHEGWQRQAEAAKATSIAGRRQSEAA